MRRQCPAGAYARYRWMAFVWIVGIVPLIIMSCGQTASSPTTPEDSPTVSDIPPTSEEMAALEPCAAVSQVRLLQTPAPVTPAPPTETPRPAPQEDRVGFPANYQEEFKLLFVFDRPDNKQVRVICGNEVAASVAPGEPFPYGSVLVMETYRARQDADGNVVTDENGNYIRAALGGIFVMRKEEGFGAAYQDDRSGEWEYVGYRPDGSYLVPPERTNACAACHQTQAGESVDYAFRMNMFFDPEQAFAPPQLAENEVTAFIYAFFPTTLTVEAGTTVTWTNNDEAEHTIVAQDSSFSSEPLQTTLINPGDSFSQTFDTPGTYPYFCSIHPAMRGTIEVTE